MKTAFLTGITGQDGSYLAEFLLNKGYEVHAILRRSSVFTTNRIEPFFNHPHLKTYHGDLVDSSNLHRLLSKIRPDEIYNLGAQSHVGVSFEIPEYTAEVDAMGTLRILDILRDSGIQSKFYQASTSEMFGGLPETAPQNEQTPFHPRSPYGVAKLYAHWMTINFRESYNLFACNGILFNHESPRRGETFVTKKITKAVASIVNGKLDSFSIGNLDAKRDWGYAKEYVEAMWLMMQQDEPDDYVIATGKAYSVRDFIEKSFRYVGIDIEWEGQGLDEKGYNKATGKCLVHVNPKYFRPAEVDLLLGDASYAKQKLNWEASTSLDQLIEIMIEYDLKHDNYGHDEMTSSLDYSQTQQVTPNAIG